MILRHTIYRWATLIAVSVATSSCSYLSIYPREGEIVYGEHDQVPVTVRLESARECTCHGSPGRG